MKEFIGFNKIYRLSREIVVTEKIDGTNAQIVITEDGQFLTGSRNRWITPQNDNYGFSKWAHENKDELMKLGIGQHFGEWFGKGIQHGYGGLVDKTFALFNVNRWSESRPACCSVVPTLYQGIFSEDEILKTLEDLRANGSKMVPGFMRPEGIIIFHKPSGFLFKKTLLKDEEPKGHKQPSQEER